MIAALVVTSVFVLVALLRLANHVESAQDATLCARPGCGDPRDLHDEDGTCHGRMGACDCTGFVPT